MSILDDIAAYKREEVATAKKARPLRRCDARGTRGARTQRLPCRT